MLEFIFMGVNTWTFFKLAKYLTQLLTKVEIFEKGF